MIGYLFIAGTLIFTIYGQLILKWRINSLNLIFPENKSLINILKYYIELFTDLYIISGFFAAFIASFFWMAAISKLELSIAYPFMSLAPAIVFILSLWFFNEEFTMGKVLGLICIIFGLILTIKVK